MKITNLSVQKSSKLILKNLSVEFTPGQTHVIMGPNGSGKSTLFYTLAGHPDCQVMGGTTHHLGHDLLTMPIHERALRGVFLGVQYPPHIEGLAHASFLKECLNARLLFQGLEAVDDFEFLKRIKALSAKYLFTSDYFKRSLNAGFSGGEKKRNEILQIELLQPSFVMLDEIDSGLDIEMMKTISAFILNYANATKVIVTHYPQFATLLKPDRVHILKDGCIAASGGAELIEQVQEHGFNAFAVPSEEPHGSVSHERGA